MCGESSASPDASPASRRRGRENAFRIPPRPAPQAQPEIHARMPPLPPLSTRRSASPSPFCDSGSPRSSTGASGELNPNAFTARAISSPCSRAMRGSSALLRAQPAPRPAPARSAPAHRAAGPPFRPPHRRNARNAACRKRLPPRAAPASASHSQYFGETE